MTGKVIDDLHVDINDYFHEESKTVALVAGKGLIDLHLLENTKPIDHENLPEVYLNGVWRPSLTVTGVDGLPPTNKAGNVIRHWTKVKVSVRLPPTMNSAKAKEIVQAKLFSEEIPYGAKVTCDNWQTGDGFCAKELPEWLRGSLDRSSEGVWGKGNICRSYGIGGSIPFLATLGAKFPETNILAVGVGSTESNAHNPNEFIVLPYAKNLIKSLSHVLVDCGK